MLRFERFCHGLLDQGLLRHLQCQNWAVSRKVKLKSCPKTSYDFIALPLFIPLRIGGLLALVTVLLSRIIPYGSPVTPPASVPFPLHGGKPRTNQRFTMSKDSLTCCSFATFWQYADSGPNPGDQDLFNGDAAGLKR